MQRLVKVNFVLIFGLILRGAWPRRGRPGTAEPLLRQSKQKNETARIPSPGPSGCTTRGLPGIRPGHSPGAGLNQIARNLWALSPCETNQIADLADPPK